MMALKQHLKNVLLYDVGLSGWLLVCQLTLVIWKSEIQSLLILRVTMKSNVRFLGSNEVSLSVRHSPIILLRASYDYQNTRQLFP